MNTTNRIKALTILTVFAAMAAAQVETETDSVSVVAAEKLPAKYTLDVSANPVNGGTVLRSPKREEYASGEAVNVVAVPASGYVFNGWSGAVVGDTANSATTVKMDANKMLIAEFAQKSESASAQQTPPPPAQASGFESKPQKPNRKQRGSRGFGGLFVDNYGAGLKWKESGEILSMPYAGWGAHLFLESEYKSLPSLANEVCFSYFSGGGKWESYAASNQRDLPYMELSGIVFGTYWKWSFDVWKLKLFPIVGLEEEFTWHGSLIDAFADSYGKSSGAYMAFKVWYKFGAGVDYCLSKKIFLRLETLYGRSWNIRFFDDKFEKTFLLNMAGYNVNSNNSNIPDVTVGLRDGLTVRLGIGFKFDIKKL